MRVLVENVLTPPEPSAEGISELNDATLLSAASSLRSQGAREPWLDVATHFLGHYLRQLAYQPRISHRLFSHGSGQGVGFGRRMDILLMTLPQI